MLLSDGKHEIPPTVCFKTNDEKLYIVEKDIVEQMEMFKQFIEDLGYVEDDVIPLPNVNSENLETLLQVARLEKEEKSMYLKNLTFPQLKGLAVVTNYLLMTSLLDDVCIYIIQHIENMTYEQVKENL
jgi:hypothetical protein